MSFAKKVLTTGLAVGSALTALAIFNNVTATLAGGLDTVLIGEERRYPWKYGDIFYKVKGASTARPLVLIHNLGPGASSYEWRKNMDALSEQFRVYALDLLGSGLSDRPAIDYNAEIYTDLVHDFLKEVVGSPAMVVARGLACTYPIACAFRRPQLFERLVMVSPPATLLRETSPSVLDSAWKVALRIPVVGESLYNLLTTRPSIRDYYDRQGYHNIGLITDDLVEYMYTGAHQPDSRFLLAALLGNELNVDVREPLARLQLPMIAVWGRESAAIRAGESESFQRANARLEIHVLDKCSDQLQDEQAVAFNALVREFATTAV